jgi:hypothetical protein
VTRAHHSNDNFAVSDDIQAKGTGYNEHLTKNPGRPKVGNRMPASASSKTAPARTIKTY